MASNEHSLPEGTLVDGRYEVRKLIGSGGMGAVYRATDMKTGHRVAVKMLHVGSGRRSPRIEERQRRLLQEVVLSGRVDHKNVVKVQDFGFDKGTPYIVMEFLDGKDLGQLLEEHKAPLTVDYVVDVMLAVCSALRACHGVNVVHRDLKPSNIMVVNSQSGPGWDIKVVDFSISKVLVEDDITEEGRVLGTVHYLAPEQFENRAGPATDQYAIGVLLYVLLTNRLPYGGFSGHTLHQAIMNGEFTDPRELRPDLPSVLGDVIIRAMRRRPEDRYPSVYELGQALWEFGSNLGRENWKKYYFHQTPNPLSAKMSSAGVPLIKQILDGGAVLDRPTSLAHYQSTTAVLNATVHDDAVPMSRHDTQLDSKPVTQSDDASSASSATAVDATLARRARMESSPTAADARVSKTSPAPSRSAPPAAAKSARASGIEIAPTPVPTSHSGSIRAGKRRGPIVAATLVTAALLGGGAMWFVERDGSRPNASAPDLTSTQRTPSSAVVLPAPSPSAPAPATPPAPPEHHESANVPAAAHADAPAEGEERNLSSAHHHHRRTSPETGPGDVHDDPTAAQLVAAADVAFERGDFNGAAALARKAINKDGGEDAYIMAGDASFKMDDLAGARAMYQEALRRNPSSTLARHRLEMLSSKQTQAANRKP